MTTRELSFDQLNLNINSVFEFMGFIDSHPDDATVSETESIIEEIKTFLRPRLCFKVLYGTHNSEEYTLTLNGNCFHTGRIVSNQLRKSSAYCLFVCTAGIEFQEFQERLMAEGDMVRVFVADAIGSCIAEACADRMEQVLQNSIDKLQWKRTNRFSPGYCGWHVSEQQMLFPIMGTDANILDTERNEPCGVRLTDSSLMIPIKSVSGVIGLGPDVRYHEYTCGFCNFEKCYKRKKRS